MNVLQTKIDEYAEFPAMVLGLDGWLLKAVPPETRNQFLRSFQKTLQIAFHPDRAQSQDLKIARERYLQVIGEAVSYLSENVINYELATDNVPSKRNPLVELRRGTEVRDELISKKCDEINELMAEVQSLEGEVKEANSKAARYLAAMQQAQYSGYRMRAWQNSNVNDLVALKTQRLQFIGETVDLPTLAERLYENSKLATTRDAVPMVLRAGILSRPRRDSARVIGAASNVHLVEYIRCASQWRDLERKEWAKVLLKATRETLLNFMVPFVAPSLAILLDTQPMTAVIVKEISGAPKRFKALDAEMRQVVASNSRIRTESARVRSRNSRLLRAVNRLEKKLKAMEKKANEKSAEEEVAAATV